MITARLLNQDARLNDYKQIGGIPFVNGDTIRIVIQFFNEELATRHLVGISGTPAASITLGVNFSDGTFADSTNNTNNIPMANFTPLDGASDTSIWFADIKTNNAGIGIDTGLTGKTLVGGNITFRINNDSNNDFIVTNLANVREGIIFNALQRVIVS